MIVHTQLFTLPIPPSQLLTHLRAITVQPYRPLTQGYTHSHELKGLPNFRPMEASIVPPHSDGIAAYRPILILHNPSDSYTIRGTGQRHGPQVAGTLLVLDIDSQHEAHSNDPNGGLGPWSGLVCGVDGKPFPKADWSVEEVMKGAWVELGIVINSLEKNHD